MTSFLWSLCLPFSSSFSMAAGITEHASCALLFTDEQYEVLNCMAGLAACLPMKTLTKQNLDFYALLLQGGTVERHTVDALWVCILPSPWCSAASRAK